MLKQAGAIAALVLAGVGIAWAAAEPPPSKVEFTVRGPVRDDAKVQFGISYRHAGHGFSQSSRPVPAAELRGLSPVQLASPSGAPVNFQVIRDAGRLDCQGVARANSALGDCRFTPNAGFAAQLQSRGIGRPGNGELFTLALEDVGLAYIDELQRQGYRRPTVAELVQAGQHDAGLGYVRAMDRAGYRQKELPTLIRLRDHDVGPRYIGELAAFGYSRLPADLVLKMRDHDVSARYVGELADLGYRGLKPESLVRLRDHDVSPAYVRELAGLGYRGLEPEILVRLRDHDVSPGFIRRVAARGAKPAPEELVRLRDRGEAGETLAEAAEGR
ncbi:MAG TPA: hypothetical protein VF559_04425 [Caulobacteraceae bacterium]|jgi:hypothetical protein